jgi:tellurite resistance protein TerC
MPLQTVGSPLLWGGFSLLILVLLALDLGVFHRHAHVVKVREAAFWSAVWISFGLAFGGFVYAKFGTEIALQYLTGYVMEKALSVDNIFVILVLMAFFAVPRALQHRVLFWGIVGALITRGVFIFLGAALLQRFSWVMYLFGVVLLYSAVKLALHRDEEVRPDQSYAFRLFRRLIPSVPEYRGAAFTVVENGRRMATPLLMVLLTIEATDLLFAVDSIPAVFAISQDPFIVYTSNIFAVLGLRSLFFLLAGAMGRFHFLRHGLSAVLFLVGAKMLIAEWYKVPVGYSLLAIAVILVVSMGASLFWPDKGALKIGPGPDAKPSSAPPEMSTLTAAAAPPVAEVQPRPPSVP